MITEPDVGSWVTIPELQWGGMKSAAFHGLYSVKVAWNDAWCAGDRVFGPEVPDLIHMVGRKRFDEEGPEFYKVLSDFVWFSYRKGLAGLPDSMSYDTGWGCVHRTGQMLLMEVLRLHLQTTPDKLFHHFYDLPSAPFSLQKIALKGASYGKEPGQWFSQSVLGRVVKDLVSSATFIPEESPLRVEVVIEQMISAKGVIKGGALGGVLVLIPLMLGITVDERNLTILTACLKCDFTVGVLGGRPKRAIYIIGCKSNRLVYLDPHRVQPACIDKSTLGVTEQPRKLAALSASELDPCCMLAFYAKGRQESLVCFLNRLIGFFFFVRK